MTKTNKLNIEYVYLRWADIYFNIIKKVRKLTKKLATNPTFWKVAGIAGTAIAIADRLGPKAPKQSSFSRGKERSRIVTAGKKNDT